MPFRDAFGDFDGRAWLNCSHQGALPLAAAEAAREAIEWKISPRRLTPERFAEVPAQLRRRLARAIGAEAEDIVLANGASFGLHPLANGLPLAAGDEVLLMAGDFPSDLLPWMALGDKGIEIRIEAPRRRPTFSPDEIEELLTPRTRVLCLPWVHSFSGFLTDIEAIGTLCRDRGVTFIANTTQGLGARPLDVSRTPVDAIVNAGWKYLCGPYATGFTWMQPALRESLTHNQAYWLATLTAADLAREDLVPTPPARTNPRRYDVFAPANFFNFVPWSTSIGLLLSFGLDQVEAHDQQLVQRLLDGLDRDSYRVVSPEAPLERSTLVLISHHDATRNQQTHERLGAAGIDVSYRKGNIRFSPHLYNTEYEIDRALGALSDLS